MFPGVTGSLSITKTKAGRCRAAGVCQHCLFLSWMNGASLFGEALTTPKAAALSSLIEGGRSLLLSPPSQKLHPPHTTAPLLRRSIHSFFFFFLAAALQCQAILTQKVTLHLPSSLPSLVLPPALRRCCCSPGHKHHNP